MKFFYKLVSFSLSFMFLLLLSGCAAGAATAATSGYSIKSQTADSLTASGEQRIVDRTKSEIMAEIYGNANNNANRYQY